MRKENIIDILSERFPDYSRKTIFNVTNEFLEVIKEILAKDGSIEFRGFGTFYTRKRNAMKARNPKTGEKVFVEDKRVPHFRPGTILKDIVKKGKYYRLDRKKRSKEVL